MLEVLQYPTSNCSWKLQQQKQHVSFETIPGMEERGMKVNIGGGDSSVIYLIYCKNFCKCYKVPSPNTTIKKKKAWYWHKNTYENQSENQLKRIKDRDMNLSDFSATPIWLLTRDQKHTIEKRQLLQKVLMGKLDICIQKTKNRSMSFTLYKYQVKVK
jgi:hypothetical protein